MIRHYLSAEFVRFLFVGVIAAGSNWLARYWLSEWLLFPLSVALAYCVGLVVAFELNRRIVFPMSGRPKLRQARDFVVINVAFFPVVWLAAVEFRRLLLYFGVRSFVDGIAHAAALALPMLVTFLIYKFVAFGGK